ncbi:MAG: DUF1330 domain-containing protein [Alphaproteobacteria bacterium]|nr:DUF1330 domain-containing protein [Alphaproteobacteria bacterium]
MSAYFILNQDLDAPQRYLEEYVPQAMAIATRHGAELIAFDAQAEALEGSPSACVVVLRFPDREAVHAFLDDPEYQPAKALRYAITSNNHAMLAPSFPPPG